MKRFFSDLKRYWKYVTYRTKCDLKAEVTGSYLSWLWLIIEPICFMLIYTFISVVVFHKTVKYYTAFVFIGLTVWNFFSKTLTASVKLIKINRDTVTKVYVPKWIILLSKIFVNLINFGISFMLVIITAMIYHVPVTWNALLALPICAVLFLFTFGFSSLFMHFGVFIEDLHNLTNIGLRMMFYLSGVFFSLDGISSKWSPILSKYNPVAAVIGATRNCLLYQQFPDMLTIGVWGVIGLVLCILGIHTIYKYENTYVKVMRS